MVAKELQDVLREITMLGFGLILICHAKKKASQFTDEEGNAIEAVEPDLSKNVYNVVNAICDLIGYINVEFDKHGNSERFLYTRQTPTIFAGSRWRYLEPKIVFGYDNLVNAISDSIEKQKKLDGAKVVDKAEPIITGEEKRLFSDVMNEVKTFWENYIDAGATEEDKDYRADILNDIVLKVFGKKIKLSSVTPAQQDLLELCLDEFKAL